MRCDVSDCTELQRVVRVHCVAAVRHWGRCIGPLNGSHFFFQMWSVNDALQPCLLAGDSPAAGLGPLGPNRHSRNHGGELAGRCGDYGLAMPQRVRVIMSLWMPPCGLRGFFVINCALVPATWRLPTAQDQQSGDADGRQPHAGKQVWCPRLCRTGLFCAATTAWRLRRPAIGPSPIRI